jgi:FkbM family methyltransferase
MHQGKDTKYYLEKGFRVVALEAAPGLAAACRRKFGDYLADGRLTIIERALSTSSGQTISFYLNPEKDDWGSAYRGAAEKGTGNSQEIHVETITMHEIVDAHGMPYYIKCDIEGSDQILVRQLTDIVEKPRYLSVEIGYPTDFDSIERLGYDRAQIVNQQLNQWVTEPNPSREGRHVGARFDGHCSALFGRDLDPGRWITMDQARDRFTRWFQLRKDDVALAIGWIDVHLTHSSIVRS